jgi:hypothetical protein
MYVLFRDCARARADRRQGPGPDHHAQPEQTALGALRILDDQIAGHVRRPVHMLLSSELVERGSG